MKAAVLLALAVAVIPASGQPSADELQARCEAEGGCKMVTMLQLKQALVAVHIKAWEAGREQGQEEGERKAAQTRCWNRS